MHKDTNNNNNNEWNHLKIIQKISEQYTWKAQKTATLGSAHILRKVLMQNYKTFSVVNSVSCTTYCSIVTVQ